MKLLIIVENFPAENTRGMAYIKNQTKEMTARKLEKTKSDDITIVFHTVDIPIETDPGEITFVIMGILQQKEIEAIAEILIPVSRKIFAYSDLRIFACEGNMIAADITG